MFTSIIELLDSKHTKMNNENNKFTFNKINIINLIEDLEASIPK